MRFNYKSRNVSGGLVEGSMQAETREEAVKKILREGLVPLEVDEQGAKKSRPFFSFQGGHPSLEDLADFLRRFSDLMEADVPLVRALQISEKRTRSLLLREAVSRVLVRVQDGTPLSKAIAAEPRIFPVYWPGLISAGELSGRLKEILVRLTQLVEKDIETKSRLVSATFYPLIILGVGLLTVFFLLVFVVPKLSDMFNELGQKLPLITQLLLLISAIIGRTWWIILLTVFLAGFWIKHMFTFPSGRLIGERFLFRIPFWGEFMKTDDMERLGRIIGLLLQSGVETVTSLECGAQTLKRETLKVQMVSVIEAVRQGTGMSMAFSRSTVFSEDVINMISVGEESGRGYQGFLQWAQVSDRRLERMTKTVTALIEPVLILLIGGIIGFIVMALLLPIFQMSLDVR